MSELEDFLAEIIPRHVDAAEALHQGDPQPLSELLARRDPISLFPGMADHRTGRDDVVAVFQTVAPKFSSCSPLTFELIAAGISGDLAYTVGYEHSAVSIDGGPIVRNDLRVTHIYRQDDGVWRLVHRHGGGGPRTE